MTARNQQHPSFSDAIPPAKAVEILCASGVQVSERTLRARARQLGAYRQIGKAIDQADLNPAFTPHVLRHTWATWFYSQRQDVLALKTEGGWKSDEWQRYTKFGSPSLAGDALSHGWDYRQSGENWGNGVVRFEQKKSNAK